MEILIDQSAGTLPGSRNVVDDILQEEMAKFLISENPGTLILFPKKLVHVEVAHRKIEELHIPGFQGAGALMAFNAAPGQLPRVTMQYNSSTFLQEYGFDRPKDATLANELLLKAREAMLLFLQSLGRGE